MVGIINYNIGNLASVYNALSRVGADARIEQNPKNLAQYSHLILPGVGAFGDAMANLEESGMGEAILEFIKTGKSVLGICLGMQLLFEKSYEFGEHTGLGVIEGEVVPFSVERLKEGEKIPHMGWNRMHILREDRLFRGISSEPYLYFVHSFHALCKNRADVLGETHYGYDFVSAILHENVAGFQPHPEKSHEAGLRVLKNFCES